MNGILVGFYAINSSITDYNIDQKSTLGWLFFSFNDPSKDHSGKGIFSKT